MNYNEARLSTDTSFPLIYLGVVEDNIDPENMGRCRIRILGLHSPEKIYNGEEGMAITDLPWATPANPIQGGSISGLGWSGVPVLGSHVAVFFIGGDHNYPVYFATLSGIYKTQPSTKKGFCDPNGVYPKELNTPDFNSLASSTNTVFETPDDGVRVEYDSTNGSEKYRVTLKKTGDTITISQDGVITINSNGIVNIIANTINLGGLSGTLAIMLNTIIDKLNNHTHTYTPGTEPPTQTATMALSLPTSALDSTDATTITKAK